MSRRFAGTTARKYDEHDEHEVSRAALSRPGEEDTDAA